jgi:hypothetical protein
MNDTWTITRTRIEEHVVPGKRLGRHYLHDSRSAFYEYPGDMLARTLADQLWARQIPILDQGNVGSCTGNAEVGLLGAAPFYAPLAAAGKVLNENTALALYSAAEVIDGDGPYPPNDNGSTGTSVMKAATANKLISGYQHATSVTAMAQALQAGPVITGVSWYDSFDTPDSSGLVAIAKSAQVRGGHEFVIRGVDIDRKLFHADNSWGTSWGVKGSFQFSWDTMATLLGQEGDCTIAVPLTQPAPTPTPPPTPAPAARPTAADRALAAAVTTWRKATGL